MTRVAAIDCGTNSIRLLVADVTGSSLVDSAFAVRWSPSWSTSTQSVKVPPMSTPILNMLLRSVW